MRRNVIIAKKDEIRKGKKENDKRDTNKLRR